MFWDAADNAVVEESLGDELHRIQEGVDENNEKDKLIIFSGKLNKSKGFPTFAEAITKILDKYKIDDKCIVSSFNPLILMKLRLKRAQTVIGFLYNRKYLFSRLTLKRP